MKKRYSTRLLFLMMVIYFCLVQGLANWFTRRRKPPAQPDSFLIAHYMLLGDTLMVIGMLARLRHLFPQAAIYFLVPEAYLSLYQTVSYQITVVGFNPKNIDSYLQMRRHIRKVDVAYTWRQPVCLPGI